MNDIANVYKPIEDFSIWYKQEKIDDSPLLQKVEELKRSTITRFNSAVKYVTKAAAVDTGAIEKLYETDRGFTYAVAAQTNAIDFIQNRKGDNFAAHFAAHLKGYEHILDHATGCMPLTQMAVRELHATLCEHQETYNVWVGDHWETRQLEHGAYKKEPNSVTKSNGETHHYCPPELVSIEIQRLIDQTLTIQFKESSSIIQAAYVHHSLTVIHPFSDGNGRVSRALATIFLVGQFGIPFLIHADQRDIYFDSLEHADSGNTKEFIFFVYDRVWETIELINENINDSQELSTDSVFSMVKKKYPTGSDNFNLEIDESVKRLSKKCIQSLNDEVIKYNNELAPLIRISAGSISGGTHLNAKPINGYRSIFLTNVKVTLSISLKNSNGNKAQRYSFDFLAPINANTDSNVLMIQTEPRSQKQTFYARVSECGIDSPKSLIYRINSWSSKVVKELVVSFLKEN